MLAVCFNCMYKLILMYVGNSMQLAELVFRPRFWALPLTILPRAVMATHVLFESASGYAIFEVKQQEEIGAKTAAFQASIQDLQKFGKMVQLISFSAFKSAAHALENANDISEGRSSRDKTLNLLTCAFQAY